MKQCIFALGAIAMLAASAQPAIAQGDDKIAKGPITVKGCVVAGQDKGTFMIDRVTRTDGGVAVSGTTDSTAFYWLEPASKLKGHVGQQVEIMGRLDDDVQKTKVKTKDGKVEMKTPNQGKVEVLAGTTAASAAGPDQKERRSYRIKVDSVKTVNAVCPKG